MEGKVGGKKTWESARTMTQVGEKGTGLGTVEVMKGGLVISIYFFFIYLFL